MGIPLLLLAMVAACGPFNLDTPHFFDNDLIRNFKKNEADFKNLVSMSNEDSRVIRIALEPHVAVGIEPTCKGFAVLKSLFSKVRSDAELCHALDCCHRYPSRLFGF